MIRLPLLVVDDNLGEYCGGCGGLHGSDEVVRCGECGCVVCDECRKRGAVCWYCGGVLVVG